MSFGKTPRTTSAARAPSSVIPRDPFAGPADLAVAGGGLGARAGTVARSRPASAGMAPQTEKTTYIPAATLQAAHRERQAAAKKRAAPTPAEKLEARLPKVTRAEQKPTAGLLVYDDAPVVPKAAAAAAAAAPRRNLLAEDDPPPTPRPVVVRAADAATNHMLSYPDDAVEHLARAAALPISPRRYKPSAMLTYDEDGLRTMSARQGAGSAARPPPYSDDSDPVKKPPPREAAPEWFSHVEPSSHSQRQKAPAPRAALPYPLDDQPPASFRLPPGRAHPPAVQERRPAPFCLTDQSGGDSSRRPVVPAQAVQPPFQLNDIDAPPASFRLPPGRRHNVKPHSGRVQAPFAQPDF